MLKGLRNVYVQAALIKFGPIFCNEKSFKSSGKHADKMESNFIPRGHVKSSKKPL